MRSIKIIILLILLFFITPVYSISFTEINPGDLFTALYNYSLILGDLDNDGDLDLILSNKIYMNDGTGHFTEINHSDIPGYYMAMGIVFNFPLADIDNDSDLDFILLSMLFENDGTGHFIHTSDVGSIYYWSFSSSLGDLDNDGDLDLIYGNHLFKNDGEGNFTKINDVGLDELEYNYCVLGDLDNDDDLDLISTGYSNQEKNEVSRIYQNDGTGYFTEINPGDLKPVEVASIVLGDIDNDSDLDLILTGHNIEEGYLTKIYQNDGAGHFIEINPGDLEYVERGALALGDLDNDGDLDLILTGDDLSHNETSKIYQNDGTGHFIEVSPGNLQPISDNLIALGDIDNDGDLDLILIGTSYNKYSKSEKQRPNWPDAYSMIYRNDEISINSNPSIPTGLRMRYSNGKWHLKWRPSIDDHTSQQMLRYKIALGDTGPGDYRLISPVIDYPRGQVNIGNVNLNSECIYEIELPITKPLYWSVCAIDSCFKQSDFSEELYTYRISGYVTNYYTGKPGSGIRIKIKGSVNGSVFTNSEGYYEFYCVKDGNVTITPFKNNLQFSPESFTIDSLSSNERVNFTIYYHERLFNFHLYPNPCKLNKNKFINFRNCSEGTTIKIYNITGDLVFSTYTNAVNYKWDIKSNKGGTVSSGVYFYRVYNKKGEEKRGKLVIIK